MAIFGVLYSIQIKRHEVCSKSGLSLFKVRTIVWVLTNRSNFGFFFGSQGTAGDHSVRNLALRKDQTNVQFPDESYDVQMICRKGDLFLFSYLIRADPDSKINDHENPEPSSKKLSYRASKQRAHRKKEVEERYCPLAQ